MSGECCHKTRNIGFLGGLGIGFMVTLANLKSKPITVITTKKDDKGNLVDIETKEEVKPTMFEDLKTVLALWATNAFLPTNVPAFLAAWTSASVVFVAGRAILTFGGFTVSMARGSYRVLLSVRDLLLQNRQLQNDIVNSQQNLIDAIRRSNDDFVIANRRLLEEQVRQGETGRLLQGNDSQIIERLNRLTQSQDRLYEAQDDLANKLRESREELRKDTSIDEGTRKFRNDMLEITEEILDKIDKKDGKEEVPEEGVKVIPLGSRGKIYGFGRLGTRGGGGGSVFEQHMHRQQKKEEEQQKKAEEENKVRIERGGIIKRGTERLEEVVGQQIVEVNIDDQRMRQAMNENWMQFSSANNMPVSITESVSSFIGTMDMRDFFGMFRRPVEQQRDIVQIRTLVRPRLNYLDTVITTINYRISRILNDARQNIEGFFREDTDRVIKIIMMYSSVIDNVNSEESMTETEMEFDGLLDQVISMTLTGRLTSFYTKHGEKGTSYIVDMIISLLLLKATIKILQYGEDQYRLTRSMSSGTRKPLTSVISKYLREFDDEINKQMYEDYPELKKLIKNTITLMAGIIFLLDRILMN